LQVDKFDFFFWLAMMFLPTSSLAVPTVDLLGFLASLRCSIFGVISFLGLDHHREEAFYIALTHSDIISAFLL
jgi:hypothetical protein